MIFLLIQYLEEEACEKLQKSQEYDQDVYRVHSNLRVEVTAIFFLTTPISSWRIAHPLKTNIL